MLLLLPTILNHNKLIYTEIIKRKISTLKNNFVWHKFSYDTTYASLTPEIVQKMPNLGEKVLRSVVANFFSKIINKVPEGHNIKVILRMRLSDPDTKESIVRTVSKLQIISKDDSQILLNIFVGKLLAICDIYENKTISNFIISYQVSDDKNLKTLYQTDFVKLPNHSSFGAYELPTDVDYLKWGKVHQNSKYKTTISDNKYTYEINKKDNERKVDVFRNETKVTSFIDYFKENENTYLRYTENHVYHVLVKNGEIQFKKALIKTNFMKKTPKDKDLKNKFITFDIETYSDNGELVPYLISFYDGEMSWSYSLTNFKSHDEMLKTGIQSLMKRKYNGYSVYAHNFSNFDGIFILRILSQLGEVTPIINQGQFIKTTLSWKSEGLKNARPYKLFFKDSYLLVKGSLDSLSKSFNVSHKLLFPVFFPNKDNLNYQGTVPERKYFNKISTSDFRQYLDMFRKNMWCLLHESKMYCEQDCISLHQILSKFNELIFNNYGINIHTYPTLPGLAMAIFKTNFLNCNNLPLLSNAIFNDLSLSYTGGRTDVFIPYGKKVYVYDVNSLFPHIMHSFQLPVGNIHKFEGNILDYEKNPFGIFLAEVTTPTDMNIPVLQLKVKINGGYRTMSPLGTFTASFTSEELKLAISHGYSVKVLKGYTFQKGLVFKDYVESLSKIKETTPKTDPMYLISKLLLNSLYGKFGMKPNLSSNKIIKNSDLDKFITKNRDKYNIEDIIELDDLRSLVTYISKDNNDDDFYKKTNKNINISIASFITSYARIFMVKMLTDKGYKVYYTDTDSIFIDKPLDEKLIHSKKLGFLKLEYILDEFVCIGPKVYAGVGKDDKGNKVEIVKIKGFKNSITFNDFKKLLTVDSNLKLSQEKWFKDISDGSITIKPQPYVLSTTENKRKFIVENNQIVDSIPYTLVDGIVQENEN